MLKRHIPLADVHHSTNSRSKRHIPLADVHQPLNELQEQSDAVDSAGCE